MKPISMLTGWTAGGAPIIDGTPEPAWISPGRGALPKQWRARTIYYPAGTPGGALARLCCAPDDEVRGRQPGRVMGVSLRTTGKGRCRLIPAQAWGISSRDPERCMIQLQMLQILCLENGLDWHATAAGLTGVILREAAPAMRALPPRFRGLSHAAIAAGPMEHVSGGGSTVAHIDRNKAFLHEFRQPQPVKWWLSSPRDATPARVLRHDGLSHMEVEVFHDEATNDLPPVSVAVSGGRRSHPVGVFRGVFRIREIKEAVDRGEMVIRRVYWAAHCSTGRYMQPFVERVLSLPKTLARLVYTRAWGKMCSRGAWLGRLAWKGNRGAPLLGLRWVIDARPWWEPGAPPYYRPDIAAWITTGQHLRMVRAVRQTAPGSLVAVHVDAMWTRDHSAALRMLSPDIGGWKLECLGECRYYAQGVYSVLGGDGSHKLGACGYQGDTSLLTVEGLQLWAEGLTPGRRQRAFSGRPGVSMGAHSSAPKLAPRMAGRIPYASEAGPYWSSNFNRRGYLPRAVVDELRENRRWLLDGCPVQEPAPLAEGEII